MDGRVRWGIVVGLCVTGAAALAAVATVDTGGVGRAWQQAVSPQTVATVSATGGSKIAPGAANAAVAATTAAGRDDASARGTYIVLFREPAVAGYQGGVPGLAAPAKRTGATGVARADMRSPQARAYARYLLDRQHRIEGDMARVIGRQPQVSQRFQHAVNGVVAELGPAEVERVRALGEVLLVDEYREYPLDTDTGPALIGAPAVWSGEADGGNEHQGEGVVFGILDSGINFGSPSFAAVDPIDGHAHANPLGAGNFLGTCAAGGIDEGRCNDKLIGGYDFVCNAPGNTCGAANIREEPGFGDSNGHGSHVASTAAGNRRDVELLGNVRRISGVAPRANIVAFDICYTNTATGQGLCPNVSAVAAVNQAIADGVVDVINYSIGGGASPWSEAVSQAFLGAVDAGIYIAASAGNSGPAPNTLGHVEPWVSSTASAQHGRGDFVVVLQVTGPQPVPEALTAIEMAPGSNGVSQQAAIPGDTPLVVSPAIDAVDDGCAAYPADTFAAAIAVVRRGTCAFSIKVDNAAAAGAVAVVVANNAAGGIIPSVPGTRVPAFGILQADGNALRDFTAANPGATAGVPYPAIVLENQPDVLAASSSRGPAGTFDLLKPDVTAPGVRILAAVAGTTITGFENDVALYNGTSMASPHQAGSAGLIRQARPGWTPPEIKSALAMTAERTVLLEDGVTPADPHAGGSGRIRVDLAMAAGLVLHETAAGYAAANPATGGDPAALNQPNMIRRNCAPQCTFVRTFRNTRATAQGYRARVDGLPARVTPANVKVPAGGTVSLRVVVDGSALPADGSWNFGELVLTPVSSGAAAPPVLQLPIAVVVPPPVIQLPDLVSLTLKAGRSGAATTTVANAGGSPLSYSFDNTGSGLAGLVDALGQNATSGFRATRYADPAVAGFAAQFSADDFSLAAPTRLLSLRAEGFVVSGSALATVSPTLTWAIYPDAGGVPAGDPVRSPGTAAWTYTAPATSAGVDTAGAAITLDLTAAGQSVDLAPGRYWLLVQTNSTFANRWAWYASTTLGDGGFAGLNLSTAGAGAWTTNASFPGLAMRVVGEVACGAPWMGAVTPPMGTLAAGASRASRIQLSAAGLTAGVRDAFYCVGSNDPAAPKRAAAIRLTVTP
ncbi:S8 family serine peptidase [Luteimonas kalidii]|uniref:S8 family serine peptidase n=1 Tax=Luteimonas kalidii TaxID=3042025 RepID=A0ABT6JTV2_9GAMM|nr:S8 family serine peptidase [Luteimonas kalidii]MDH5834116.1 S8 family serine peptidase [Luteimonas kalidii]